MISPNSQLNYNGGFFSCCSVILQAIVEYINAHKSLPIVNTSDQFNRYKPESMKYSDITYEYFEKNTKLTIEYIDKIDYHESYQYKNYSSLEYLSLVPLVRKYFSPSKQIKSIISMLEEKYGLHDYTKLAVLFYRGNDKIRETKLSDYQDTIERAKKIKEESPSIRFLIQSDETEFIERMIKEFPGSFYFKDEIRHMAKCDSTVDTVFKNQNYEFSKYYLAITIIMSKCKYVVSGSNGNCSIWIALYRGNANNFYQH